VLLAILVTVPERLVPGLGSFARPVLVALAWLAFAAVLPLSRHVPPRFAVPVILAGAVALPLAATLATPGSSDDVYRYIWDGRVQAAGIDPYAHPPAAPDLVGLRDPSLWPDHSAWCVAPGDRSPQGEPLAAGCTLINRPAVHTIYPPAAELYFLLVHALSPTGSLATPFQLAGAAFAVATTLVLFFAARSRGTDPRWIVAWAWCPAVPIEAANNAHVDVVSTFLTALALLCLCRPRPAGAHLAGGALLGLAVATKLTPLLALPAIARRRPLLVTSTMFGIVAVLYVPHVLRVGPDVIGYLPGYLAEEGYTTGNRFALLTLIVPTSWAPLAAVVVLGAVALLVIRNTDPDRPWIAAATMTGATLLVTTPAYAWYALLLVLLVGLGARPAWLWVVAAGYVAQYSRLLHMDAALAQRLGYGLAVLAVAATWHAQRHRQDIGLRV
jgi:hypothetical protein